MLFCQCSYLPMDFSINHTTILPSFSPSLLFFLLLFISQFPSPIFYYSPVQSQPQLIRSESLRNLSPTHSPAQSSFVKPSRPRSLVISELGLQSPDRPHGVSGYETFHYSLSPQFGAHSPSTLASMYLSSPVGVRPSYSKTMKPLRTVREEHQGRSNNANRRSLHKVSLDIFLHPF